MSRTTGLAGRTLATAAVCTLAGCWADFPESRFRADVGNTPLDAAGADLVVDQGSDSAARDGTADAAQKDTLQKDTLQKDTLQKDTLKPDTLQPDTLKPDTLQPDTTVNLPLGSQCTVATQCTSGFCECQENSSGCAVRICCAQKCSSGESCKSNGKFCQ